jgi:tRNA threonylcarbamoyladenosine biosynthesis protein TsaE
MAAAERYVATAAEMEALGERLAAHLGEGCLIALNGPLGAGKTTLVRGLLRGLGYAGAVKSPTFTLVEPYELADRALYHFDLYRLEDPQELAFLGLRDYLSGKGICVVEWAERAQGVLPAPDVEILIAPAENARMVRITAHTDRGKRLLEALA